MLHLPEDIFRTLSECLPYKSLNRLWRTGTRSLRYKLSISVFLIRLQTNVFPTTPNIAAMFPHCRCIVFQYDTPILPILPPLQTCEWFKTLESQLSHLPFLTDLTVPQTSFCDMDTFVDMLPRQLRRLEVLGTKKSTFLPLSHWYLLLPPQLEVFRAPTVHANISSANWLPSTITEWSLASPTPFHIFELLPHLQRLNIGSMAAIEMEDGGSHRKIPDSLLYLGIEIPNESFSFQVLPTSLQVLDLKVDGITNVVLKDVRADLPYLSSLKLVVSRPGRKGRSLKVQNFPMTLTELNMPLVDLWGPEDLLLSCTQLQTLVVDRAASGTRWYERISSLTHLVTFRMADAPETVTQQLWKLPCLTDISCPLYGPVRNCDGYLGSFEGPHSPPLPPWSFSPMKSWHLIQRLDMEQITISKYQTLPPLLHTLSASTICIEFDQHDTCIDYFFPKTLTVLQCSLQNREFGETLYQVFQALPLLHLELNSYSSGTYNYLKLLPYLPTSLTHLAIHTEYNLEKCCIRHLSRLHLLRELKFVTTASSKIEIEDLLELPLGIAKISTSVADAFDGPSGLHDHFKCLDELQLRQTVFGGSSPLAVN